MSDKKKKDKKDKKEILPDKWQGQKRRVPIAAPPKGFWYDPKVKESKSKNKPHGASLNDAIKFYIENPEKYGTPSWFDMKARTVEFDNGKNMSFEEIMDNYVEDSGNYKKSGPEDQWGRGGFYDGPVDLGKDPKGDFPSSQWMPRGHEDEDVDPNLTTANLGLSKLDKTAATILDKQQLDISVYNYIQTLDESYWLENFGEEYLENFTEQYEEQRGRFPSQQVRENIGETLTDKPAEWWFNEYGDIAVQSLLDNLEGYETEEELAEDYPDIYKFYKQVQTESIKDSASSKNNFKKKAQDDKIEPLSNKMMVDMVPIFTDSTKPDNHNCGNCNMRYTDKDGIQRCTVVEGKISYDKGTCNYMAPGEEASEEDSVEMKMGYDTAGYVEVPKKSIKVNCSTCKYYDPEYKKDGNTYIYCKLWGGSVKPEQCCMAWDRDDVTVPQQETQKKALKMPELTTDQKAQIAAEYGVEYNSAVKHYLDAKGNGHPHERALEYADEEMQKVDLPISIETLSLIIDFYY